MTKIVFLVGEDWYFLSHRKALGEACRALGWDVVVATHVTDRAAEIEALGFTLEPLPLERSSANPLRELRAILAIRSVLLRHRPDIVHCVALKPVLYGNLAALLAGPSAMGRPAMISALAGMGHGFGGTSLARRLVSAVFTFMLRFLLQHARSKIIVQNPDDRDLLLRADIAVSDQITLIPGSGVNLDAFPAMPEPAEMPVRFALVARMLAEKGVPDSIAAMRLLRQAGIAARLLLVGAPDPHNPSSLTESELRAWETEGLAEWLGHRSDVAAVWRDAHVALLPSYYREGMPKALLEAASCARPIITSDSVGCREVIDDGVEGLVVKPRDPALLADAMRRLVEDGDLRRRMGLAARRRAESRFGVQPVIEAHLALYRRALVERGGAERGSASR